MSDSETHVCPGCGRDEDGQSHSFLQAEVERLQTRNATLEAVYVEALSVTCFNDDTPWWMSDLESLVAKVPHPFTKPGFGKLCRVCGMIDEAPIHAA